MNINKMRKANHKRQGRALPGWRDLGWVDETNLWTQEKLAALERIQRKINEIARVPAYTWVHTDHRHFYGGGG